MFRRGDGLLIVACVVVGLAILVVNGHPPYVSPGLSATRSISAGYALHMAELEFRHLAEKVGRFVSMS